MEDIFIQILNMGITAGWLILAVIAARFLLKKAPRRFTMLLWGLVALRLILPFSIEAPTSLVPSAETISPSALYANRPEIHSGITALNRTVNPVIETTLAPSLGDGASPVQALAFIGSNLWLLGMAALLVYAVVSSLRLRRKVREAVLLRENIWICDQVETPFVLGVFRPRIYLPSWLADGPEAGKELDAVLAHEKAHLSRRDPLWKGLGFLLLTVYWFHPLVWAAYLLLCRDIETACDERVIRDMDLTGKKAYAHALVTCGRRQRAVLVCPLAFGEVSVKERVKSVLNYKKPGFWILIAALAVCAVVIICFVTNPAKKEAASQNPPVLKVKVESLKSLISKTRENGMEYVRWFAAGVGETEVGWIPLFRLEEYLANADWKECGVPGSLPESEHFLITVGSEYRMTLYKEPALACVAHRGEEKYYQIGAEDYEAMWEVFSPYSKEDSTHIYYNNIPIYTPYVGDASKVSQIARSLPWPEGYTYDSIKIWSETEPYGLDIFLNGSIVSPENELPAEMKNAFRTCAEYAFASIGNLGAIRFYVSDEYGQKWFLYESSRAKEGVPTEIPYGSFKCGGELGATLTLEKGETFNQFNFAYDLLSSYWPYGSVVRQGDVIVCRTLDGQCQYTFKVKDADTLLFDAKNSSPVHVTDEGLSGEKVEDGSVFKRWENPAK